MNCRLTYAWLLWRFGRVLRLRSGWSDGGICARRTALARIVLTDRIHVVVMEGVEGSEGET